MTTLDDRVRRAITESGKGPERWLAATNHRVSELLNNYAKCGDRGKATVLTVAEREAEYGHDA